MRLIPGIAAAAALAALTACGSSSASSPAAAPASPAPASAAAPAKALAPLTIGHFPSTVDGKLARETCQQWSGLRQDYAAKLAAGTAPFAMNAWFGTAAWAKAQADATALGDAADYTSLIASFGVATDGQTASTANAGLLDKACTDAD
jgi:hypothetical protein